MRKVALKREDEPTARFQSHTPQRIFTELRRNHVLRWFLALSPQDVFVTTAENFK